MKNTVLDFSKMRIVDRHSRAFDSGFIQTYGQRESLDPALEFPGYAHSEMAPRNNGETLSAKEFTSIGQCDTVIEEPTFVLSNDDIYNLGHYINDVMGIWAMSVLANRDTKSSILLNIDGFRRGGPAGGHPHRLMEPSDPDRHGPYIGYYDSWFRRIDKALDHSGRRVCFRELYFPPEPGVPWFWNDWSLVNACSMQSPSPLYQSFNYFLRERWAASNRTLQHQRDTQDDVVHVVIEVRSINPNKAVKKASTSRHIRNLDALLIALRSIPNVKVTAQDFALIPFEEQVSLSHSAGVFMSMHGAGTTHIFHMALGSPNCCALVELQPDHSLGFQNAQGYGNLARMMGLHHYRYEAADGLSTELGTEVEIDKVKDLVQQAVKAVRSQRTCLLDPKDSRKPLYDKDL